MGPHTADIDPLFTSLNRLRQYCRAHPEVIVSRPSETFSGLWELSLPDSAAMGFSTVERLVEALDEIEGV
jgi:hypothetical protein